MSKIKITDLIEGNYLRKNGGYKIKITDLIKDNPKEKSAQLLCDNPQCGLPIPGDVIAFSPDYREIYHPGGCITYAMTIKAFNSREIVFGNIDYITRKKALKIKSGLETKTK